MPISTGCIASDPSIEEKGVWPVTSLIVVLLAHKMPCTSSSQVPFAPSIFLLMSFKISVNRLHFAIGLWSRYWTESDLDVESVTILYCVLTDELLSIVCDDDEKDVVPRDDISPYELTNLLICDGVKGFGFHILGKVVNGHNDELSFSLSWWEGAKKIHSPFVKRQESFNSWKIVRWLSTYLWVVLAGYNVWSIFRHRPERRPVVSTSQDFAYDSSYSLVDSASTFVYFTKDVIPFFRGYTLQKGVCVWFFVERSFVEFEPFYLLLE